MLLVVMFVIMLLFLFAGFPIMIPLFMSTIIAFFIYFPGIDQLIIAQQTIGGVLPITLIAVPLYIFSAAIITSGQSANHLINLVMSLIGHVRGGLPMAVCGTCTIFGAISGSTMSTVAAIGSPMRPKLLERGYSSSFSTALIINASDVSLLIPPSLGAIFYGVVTGTSIGELFIAGIGPGILITLLFCLYCYLHARVLKVPVEPKASWADRLRATKKSLLPMGYPIIVIGGIYTGLLSPTEAAAFLIIYALILEVLVYRAVKLSDIPRLALSTGVITSVVLILVGAGTAFSWVISFAQIPDQILPNLLGPNPSAIRILFVIGFAYLIGCMFIDNVVVIFILSPILHPIAVNAGIDPVFVGTLVILQAAIGSATPPFGCDIFTAIAIFRRPYFEIVKGTPPFILILLLVYVLMVFFPEIALFLRDLAFT